LARIEVHSEVLTLGGSRQAELAGRIRGLCGQIDTVAAAAAGAAGEARAAGAISDACSSWSTSVAALSDSIGGVGTNLGAASIAYEGTDARAMPGR